MLYRFNKASYAAMPRRNSFLVDMQAAAQGVVVGTAGWPERLEANKQAVAAAWVARPEFKAVYDALSNAQYVDALFRNAGVQPSQAERDALVAGLDAGTETRATVLRKVADNAAFRAQGVEPGLRAHAILRLPPPQPRRRAGHEHGRLQLLAQQTQRARRRLQPRRDGRAFINSIEYRERFDW